MILNVPLIKQPKDSRDCGIAGLAMIFKFYGIDKSFADIKKAISVDKVGTYSPQLGVYMINHGFDVELITLHPKLFTLKDMNCSRSRIIRILDERLKSTKSIQDKKVIRYFKRFIHAGGKISVKIPDMDDIIDEIDKRRPLGAVLTSNFLSNDKPIFNFHFNILTGYDRKYVYANDPLWDKRGGRKKYLIPDFFYGLYASAYGDIDNAMLIKIRKR